MSWEDSPNFIPCVEYLCELDKLDHALALYMLAFIDVPKNCLESFLDIPAGVPMKIFDRSQEMIVHYMSKKLGPKHELIKRYRNRWNETIGEISKKYADKIYSLIEFLKYNEITMDYFYIDNLDDDDDDAQEKQYKYITEKLKKITELKSLNEL